MHFIKLTLLILYHELTIKTHRENLLTEFLSLKNNGLGKSKYSSGAIS